MKLFTAKQSRELDGKTMLGHGVPSTLLMENAAAALAAEAEKIAKNKTAAVLCGSGNNGGDGIAVSRILMQHGFTARVLLVGNRDKMTPDALEMQKRLETAGGKTEDYSGKGEQLEYIRSCGLIVDAMLGTGLSSDIRGKYAEAVELINSLDVPVASADIPSGISSDTGDILGTAVKADVTVTFGFPKIGQYVEPGCVYCGKLICADIGILPDDEIFSECVCEAITAGEAKTMLPPRAPLSHKGDYGKVLIIAGSTGYTGAPYLASEAAVRSGAGLVYLGVPQNVYSVEAVKCTEAMPFPLASANGEIDGKSAENLEHLREKFDKCSVCLAGPGLGRGAGSRALIKFLLENSKIPVILDADGINALSGNIDILDRAACPVVLTPHGGEFARVGGTVDGDRIGSAAAFAFEHRCILVLKGYRSITAFPDGRCVVNTTGNPGMAKGGSGDVLAGVITALAGQMPLEKAVPLAVFLHSRAGDLAAERYGEYSMTPSDIISLLPEAFSGS